MNIGWFISLIVGNQVSNYLCIFSMVPSHIADCLIFPRIISHPATLGHLMVARHFNVAIHRYRRSFIESISHELLLSSVPVPGMVIKEENTILIVIQLWEKQFFSYYRFCQKWEVDTQNWLDFHKKKFWYEMVKTSSNNIEMLCNLLFSRLLNRHLEILSLVFVQKFPSHSP